MAVDLFAGDIAPWRPGECPRCGGPTRYWGWRETKGRPRILPARQTMPSRRSRWVTTRIERPASRPIRVRPGRWVLTQFDGFQTRHWEDPNRCPDCSARALAAAHAGAYWYSRIGYGGSPTQPAVVSGGKQRRADAARRAHDRARKHRARQAKGRR